MLPSVVVGRLAPLVGRGVGLNTSAKMTPGVSIPLCELPSDSMIRFGAYVAPLLGAQAIWWEGVGACAPVGSPRFRLVSTINTRLATWVEPLFLRQNAPVPGGNWRRRLAAAEFEFEGEPGLRAEPPDVPGTDEADGVSPEDAGTYRVDAIWSTAELALPALPGVNGSAVRAQRPGHSPAALVQAMSSDLIVVHLRNMTANTLTPWCCGNTAKKMAGDMQCRGGSKAGPGPEQQCDSEHHNVLLVLSTRLSTRDGGAPTRQLNITLREDVWTTHPIEPAPFHGFTSDCNLNWLGPAVPLRLAGGSAALVSYTLVPPYVCPGDPACPDWPGDGEEEDERADKIGRRAPSRWQGAR